MSISTQTEVQTWKTQKTVPLSISTQVPQYQEKKETLSRYTQGVANPRKTVLLSISTQAVIHYVEQSLESIYTLK